MPRRRDSRQRLAARVPCRTSPAFARQTQARQIAADDDISLEAQHPRRVCDNRLPSTPQATCSGPAGRPQTCLCRKSCYVVVDCEPRFTENCHEDSLYLDGICVTPGALDILGCSAKCESDPKGQRK